MKKVEPTELRDNCRNDMEIIQDLKKEIDQLYEQIYQEYMESPEDTSQLGEG